MLIDDILLDDQCLTACSRNIVEFHKLEKLFEVPNF